MKNDMRLASSCLIVLGVVVLGPLGGCPQTQPPDENAPYDPTATQSLPIYHNTTDPTNQGAHFIGSRACSACHTDIYELTRLHGHTHAMTGIDGAAPQFPPQATRAAVPDPPTGLSWNDVAYVIAGYLHGAYFVDQQGYLMTTGATGVDTRWLLDFPANATSAGFVPLDPNDPAPRPLDYETCFRCHTTGPQPQDPNDPRSQDSRPGILGTWSEPGVQCEACHGPGSNHVPNPQRRNIFVDSSPQTCGRCHTVDNDPNTIPVQDGFIAGNAQVAELKASGGHGEFTCMICHNPHASTAYDRDNGLRNDCTVCHTDQNMAFHEGLVYRWGDYEEPLSCQSCHMPLAAKTASAAPAGLVGELARIGDVRAHIFRIEPDYVTFDDMFTPDGSAVRKDEQGRAGLSPAFVCLRCHNDATLFPLTLQGAASIARGLHERAAQNR